MVLNEEQYYKFDVEWRGSDVIHPKFGRVPVVDTNHLGYLSIIVPSSDFYGMTIAQIHYTEVNKAA